MNSLIPIKLQLFAQDEGLGAGGDTRVSQDTQNQNTSTDSNANTNTDEEKDTKKTYTQDDVEKLKLELSEQKDKENETKIQEAINKALEEEKRKAKLSKDELEKEEKQKLLDEIQNLKNDKQASILKEQALNKLSEKQLPNSFLSFVMGQDEQSISDNISSLKVEFDKAVQEKVEERLKGKTPIAGSNVETITSIESEFEKALKI